MGKVYNKGYIGDGKYNIRKDKYAHSFWIQMLRRCYSDNYHIKNPTYKECTVHDEWLNFQNFCGWFYNNYYKIENQRMCLDKDILHKNNKEYSSVNCVFAPNDINVLFTKRQNRRGKYPIGVYWDKDSCKYKSQLTYLNKRINLGRFNTSEEAFKHYKIAKEKAIKEVADKYKNQIPKKLYDAMCSYEVEITD